MKHLSLVLLILFSCRSAYHRQENVSALTSADSLTLRMTEVQLDKGQPMAALMLCQRGNCQNVLRDKNGEDYFYFHNLAGVYNEKVEKEGKGNKVRMILLGIATAATLASIVYYIRSDVLRQKISKHLDFIGKLRKKKPTGSAKNTNELAELDKQSIEMAQKERKLTRTYYGTFATGGFAAASLLIPGIAEDNIWKENKRTLSKLFVHGEAIKVTKDELHDLLDVLVKHVPATVDATVRHFVYDQ